jgi:hypothetical protein
MESIAGCSPSSTSHHMVSNDTKSRLCVIYCLHVNYDILELFRNTVPKLEQVPLTRRSEKEGTKIGIIYTMFGFDDLIKACIT